MTTTPNLQLPYLAAGQAQKHVTVNEALRILDALAQIAVLSRNGAAPPATPADGACYIVAPSATGAWAGHAGKIAAFRDGGWSFLVPREGWIAWVSDEDKLYAYDGTAWASVQSSVAGGATFGVNATADTTNRLSVASPATLLSHEGAGHQVKVNKAAAANTATLLFQNGFSGRAEIGLAGDDNLRFKVSADGAAWSEAMAIDRTNARIGIGVDPSERLHVKGNLRLQDSAAFIGFYNSTGSVRTGYFQAHATAGFYFAMEQNLPMYFYTNNALRIAVKESGEVGIGTASPTTRLHVDGTLRVGNYSMASLPSASTSGAGSMIYISNESGGAVLAFSDGASWRRVTDRAVVS